MNSENRLVSVIVPCYNQGEFLCECIESILTSTYRNLEIVVVDDGSTDPQTKEVLRNLNYDKPIVINQDNQGLPSARNAGIAKAKGRYILPVDADDKIAPSFLEKAVSVLEKDQRIGIVGGLTELFGAQTGIFKLPKYTKSGCLLRNCLVCTQMFRREDWCKVGGYNPNMIYGFEDWDFWLSLIELGRKVYQFNEVVFLYRKHSGSMIGNISSDEKKMMWLQGIENHPHLYRWRGNYRHFVLTGKHSFRRRFLDLCLKTACIFVPVKRWRKAIRALANNVP